MNQFPAELISITKEYVFTGSSVVCDPPVLNTDVDLVIYVESIDYVHNYLCEFGFTSKEGDYKDFRSYRRDHLNLIVVDSRVRFTSWSLATHAAKALNITDKADRVAFFEIYHHYIPLQMKDI